MSGSWLTGLVLVVGLGLLVMVYLLPVLVGWARRVPDIGAVAAIDILLGWTFVGWVVALAMALRSVHPAVPVIQVTQNPPPPSLPPGHSPNAEWAGPPGPPRPRRVPPPPLVLPKRPPGWGHQADEDYR